MTARAHPARPAVPPPQVTIQAAVDRDTEFTAFMQEAVDPLHRMAYLLSGDRHRAEELVQHALERTYRKWPTAREGNPLAYARRVVANARIDTWRRTRREVLSAPEEMRTHEPGGSDPGIGRVADRDAVVHALLALPLKQRRVVVLRHLMDLSEDEVARELGLPRGTVKSTTSRALARLRTALDPTSGEAS